MLRSRIGCFVLYCVALACLRLRAQGEEVGVFSLIANRQYDDSIPAEQHPRDGDLAYREFIRQGLLMTARDEFGLATRDETLLETVDRESPETFNVVVVAKLYHGLNFQVSRDGKQLLDLYIRDMLENAKAYQVIAEAVEEHSRNAFAKMLEEAGYARRPHRWLDTAKLPEGAEELLQEMNDISQFRALRAIHQAIRESGESPERLGGLVRGYSNLSQLTVRGIDCRGFAFRCRAWLYAERLRQKTKRAPTSDWHWAYMAMMVGEPTPAKEAIERARRSAAKATAEGKTAEVDAPAWGDLIELYCEFRVDELAARAEDRGEYCELATVLCVRALQQFNSKLAVIEGGKAAMEQLPTCLWIQEQMYQAAGVSLMHSLVRMGPELLSNELTELLPTVAGLPPQVEQLLGQEESLDQLAIARVAAEIVAAGKEDRQEPSLEVLGRNIEAFNMLHIFRVAYFYKFSLGSDAEQYIDQVSPAAKNHPLFPFLQTFRLNSSHPVEEFAPLMKGFSFKDGNPFIDYELYGSLPGNLQLANMPLSEARDLCWYGQMEDEEFIAADAFRSESIHPTTVSHMKWVSAESPLRLGALLRDHYDEFKDKEQEWLDKYGHYASIHSALGRVYAKRRDYKKAAEHLEIAVAKVADYSDLNALASAYYKLGDDRWLTTIKRVLDREDYGLEHSAANAAITATLMSEGKFREALPYAEQAAYSGAGWAYYNYIECLTGLGRWDEAEQLARRTGSRYRTSTWFDWCVQTGKGDLDAAWQEEQQRHARFASAGNREIEMHEVLYHIAAGRRQQALDFVTKKLEDRFSPWNCMQQAMLADELGDARLRNQALAMMAIYQPQDDAHWNPYKYLAIAMQQALREDRSLGMGDIEAIFANRGDLDNWINAMRYFVANFNWLHAEGEDKTAELKEMARLRHFDGWARLLAWIRLRDSGIDPILLDSRQFDRQYSKSEK